MKNSPQVGEIYQDRRLKSRFVEIKSVSNTEISYIPIQYVKSRHSEFTLEPERFLPLFELCRVRNTPLWKVLNE